jgi:hypothetical protein
MNESERKDYLPPAILLEMELETRAGSSLGEVFDELLEDE